MRDLIYKTMPQIQESVANYKTLCRALANARGEIAMLPWIESPEVGAEYAAKIRVVNSLEAQVAGTAHAILTMLDLTTFSDRYCAITTKCVVHNVVEIANVPPKEESQS